MIHATDRSRSVSFASAPVPDSAAHRARRESPLAARGRDWVAVGFCSASCFSSRSLGAVQSRVQLPRRRRAASALSTQPLLRRCWSGAALGVEKDFAKKKRRCPNRPIAGVFAALAVGLADAPAGLAGRGGECSAATFCMSLCIAWSRPFIARSRSLAFTDRRHRARRSVMPVG